MKIKRARAKHASLAILGQNSDLINGKDLCLIAEKESKPVGLIWCGLMANGTLGYVDYFWVHPEHRKQGIGEALCKRLVRVAQRKGVKDIIASVEQNEFHEASGINALKAGMGARPNPHTAIFGNVDKMAKLLGVDS